ncbi:unnamed protein product [Ranitomeya imitator]|uniref:Uncharacterized protein n=1 Tax=Ranitomeya imitator TaxID=111125 RepID=A0ABN9KT67_9NEOB|nr:unnamed protein product [Ranitomeya imitator]
MGVVVCSGASHLHRITSSSCLHAAAPAQMYFVCPVESRAKYCSAQALGLSDLSRRLRTAVLCSVLNRADKVRLRRSVKTRRGRPLKKMGGPGPDRSGASPGPLKVESFQKCCKAGLDLHHAVLSNEYLKVYCKTAALSAEIILTLLRYSGLPNESDETESLQPEIVRVFDNTTSLTIKWLEDVYGQKFTFYHTRTKTFSLEMQAWSMILNAGEKVTPKWKASLLPILCRKINQFQRFENWNIQGSSRDKVRAKTGK